MKQVQGLPELLITLGRRRLTAAETATVQSIRTTSTLAMPSQCVLVLRGDDSSPGARLDPETGDALVVSIGGHREPLFTGEITVVEYSYGADLDRIVRVRAYDALHRLRKRQFTRLHDDVDLSALARTVSDGTGLGIVGDGTAHLGQVYQLAESDLELLVRCSASVGIFPVVVADALHLVSLAGEGEPIELELGSSMHSVDIEVSQEPAFRSATVSGWSPDSAAELDSTWSNRGARAAVRADPSPAAVGGGGPLLRQNETTAEAHRLDLLGKAELDIRSAGEISATVVADGDTRIRAGARVRLSGVASALEGDYTVTSASHVIDGNGYETSIATLPPGPPASRRSDQVTLGIVTDIDDPEQRARVRVRMPAWSDLECAWAPCLVAGAGADKGSVILPAVGDTVLLLLAARDPSQVIVLGGLYGSHQTPDAQVAGDRGGLFTVTTPDGQRITLNSTAKTAQLTDGHGSVVELGPDLLRITAATDVLFEAPGRAMTIRARTVDFEEAP